MKTEEMIAVMQASGAGDAIEFREIRPVKPKDGWMLCDNPCWNWVDYEYRVKPEPLECWVNVYKDGSVTHHHTKESAEQWAAKYSGDEAAERVAVHLKEVQE